MNRFISKRNRSGFTLFELIMALMILGLLSGAVYSISTAALETTKAVISEQAGSRRLEAFLKVTRDAFSNLPADGKVFLRLAKSSTGSPIPELVFMETSGAFGVSSLGGGSLILAARPRADGTRTFSLLRLPPNSQGIELERLRSQGAWVSLLPGVEKVKWLFFKGGEWIEEWPEGAERLKMARLQFEYDKMPGASIDVIFWIPSLVPPQEPPKQNAQPVNPKSPEPNEKP
jgi:prepilin-type N-terminal cleavage/methylation domain-containing protein